jgi:hypothetical protein
MRAPRIEAGLRELLPPEAGLERLRAAIGRLAARLPAPRLLASISMRCWTPCARPAPPGALGLGRGLRPSGSMRWAGPGSARCWRRKPRPATRCALIAGLQALDAILGRIDRNEALRQLRRQCRDHDFCRAAPRARRASRSAAWTTRWPARSMGSG